MDQARPVTSGYSISFKGLQILHCLCPLPVGSATSGLGYQQSSLSSPRFAHSRPSSLSGCPLIPLHNSVAVPSPWFATDRGVWACLVRLSSTEEATVASHPNKEIRAALESAKAAGWTVKKSGSRAHAWDTIRCGHGHTSCWMAVYSTPRNPQNHAKQIRKKVAACPGPTETSEEAK